MATSKHRNLTVDTLTVTGSVTLPEGTIPAPAKVEARPAPVVHPGDLPEKTTNAALRERVEYLTAALTHAGILKHAPAPGEGDGYPAAPAAPAAPEVTPQAVAAGVVDGA